MDLTVLFSELPKHCVVLIEDIDSASIQRKISVTPANTSKDAAPSNSNAETSTFDVKALNASAQKVSLSGFFIIIDGVAAAQGRMLIMTSNMKESLDPALMRPGRVDFTLEFTNASKEVAMELFTRMFTVYPENEGKSYSETTETPSLLKASELEDKETETFKPKESENIATLNDKLETYAKEFAAKIPAGKFSPAKLQGFLIKHMNKPQKACREVEE